MILSILLLSTFLFSQSFDDKPEVPIFHVDGQAIVRVDCWRDGDEMSSHYLRNTEHPKVFTTLFNTSLYEKIELEVSLLKSENTLKVTQLVENEANFQIETYGLDCGYKMRYQSLYCSVFNGEIFEEIILNSQRL